MSLSKLKVAVATMNSTPDYNSNMKAAEELVEKAAKPAQSGLFCLRCFLS